MLIGIDVGGTFTDGVLFDNGSIVTSAKKPTSENNLKDSLLQVLDALLINTDKVKIDRIVFSTTLVTNLLATGRGQKTALILIPGHGLPCLSYEISPDTYFLKGSIDFRGRQIEALDRKEILAVADKINNSGIKRVAVAGKFSNRNHSQELMVRKIIQEKYPDMLVSISSEISGKLNFPRRAVTTYFTAMTLTEWNKFADEIEAALERRGIKAEVDILKADGGTIPLEVSRTKPCETVFSGPAASTMGAVALSMDDFNSVVLDIGGTTTDISLIISGQPLYASKGARIEEQLTHIDAFAVKSIPLGGDSLVAYDNGTIKVKPERKDAAACFGGKWATVTDAFNIYNSMNLGDTKASVAVLGQIADNAGITVDSLCSQVVQNVIAHLVANINGMFTAWENEPAYKVWEVINKRKFKLNRIIGIGAAAGAIIPAVAEKMKVDYLVHEYSPVANALGASVVRPTLAVNLHVDTQNQVFTVDPGGINGKLDHPTKFQLTDARELARKYLVKIAQDRGIEKYAADSEFYMEEQFNMIRGWDRIGKLFEVGVQIAPGFIEEYKGVKI
ncbi:MAG: hydantoinase/oxoprolinase family protein [Syntrophomonadaceae bacterium]|nr:hydantoinase/oxoprolinase family protein [Syntrophomonadaceae bacterium]MDD3889039.1 hydantoinase/oxoprolinase family protein [Syntrophomonadaceae bacterium]MDD4549254.1 hydantoinase/oxoprolinase family protein [Syntrophomonadaceae bacterium]